MRILYLLDQDFPDRNTQTIQVMNMGVELARLGVRTHLFVRRLLVPDRDELHARFGLTPEPGFTVHPLHRDGLGKLNRWRGPPFVARLANLVRRHGGPDTVLYSRGWGAVESARLAAAVGRPFGVPVFYEVHKFYGRSMAEYYRDESRRKANPTDYLERKLRHLAKVRDRENRMLRSVTGLIAINRGIEAELRQRFGPDRPVALIPSAARAPARIPPDEERDLDVVYLGDVAPKKGVDVLIDAMALLPGRRLVIHGKGRRDAGLDELRAHIAASGLDDRVTYGGWIPPSEVPPLLARARASVLPYRGGWAETVTFVSPIKAYELALAGVPFVASDLPALREVVRDGETGLLVPPDDPAALAEGLRRVLEDRDLAWRLSAGAREAARDFTWRRRAERVLDFVREVRERRYQSSAP